MKTNLLMGILLMSSIHAFPQMSVLNGSFENISSAVASTTCLSDSAWTIVDNSMGLPGGVQSLVISDPFTDPVCVNAQHGFNYVDLPTACADVAADHVGLSLELSQSLSEGTVYKLSFYAKKCDPTYSSAPVNIGYSSDPVTFGTSLFSSPVVSNDQWTYFEHVFTFISAGMDNNTYLTVSTESPLLPLVPYSIQIDNINLEEINTSSINNSTITPDINIYPNPSSENVMISFYNKNFTGSLTITDLSGKVLMTKKAVSVNNFQIDRSIFESAGIYILCLEHTEKSNTTFHKIIIR